jgi:hypothetical protein
MRIERAIAYSPANAMWPAPIWAFNVDAPIQTDVMLRSEVCACRLIS